MFTSSFEKTASGKYGNAWKKFNRHAKLEKTFSGSKNPKTVHKATDHFLKKMDTKAGIDIDKTFDSILKKDKK